MCIGTIHVDDLTCLAEVAMTEFNGVMVDVVLKVELLASNNGLFKFWQLFEGEKWRRMKDVGGALIIINNVLKAAKNIAYFLHYWEVLGNEGYPINHILCLSSEEVMMVFHCGMSELAIDELSIVSRSYEGVLQHPQVSVTIPHDDGIAATASVFNTNNCQFPDAILQLICFILGHNIFTFNNQFLNQTHGTAMGTRFAPQNANIFMRKFLYSREVLDDKEYSVGCIPCLSSEE
eukprot:g45337.t1